MACHALARSRCKGRFSVSFFDDDDPPTRAQPSVRRSASGAASSARARVSGGGGGGGDQQLLVRRAIALGALALLLILIVVGVNSCRNTAKKNALRDYNRDVAQLVGESDNNVAKPFFTLLTSGNKSNPNTLETTINQYRVVAEEQGDRARHFDVPGDMAGAQRTLLMVLDFRSEVMAKVADKIRSVYGNATVAATAVQQIAGQMQKLLASDVIYSQRVTPLIQQTLDANAITGQTIAASTFLPNLGWLNPATVASRLGSRGGGGTSGTGVIAPGLHGHALGAVTVGTTTLQPPQAVNRIPASSSVAFDVKFTNGGVNDETDVPVRVKISGAGKAINVTKTVDSTKAGAQADVTIPLGQAPPIGTPVTITVSIGKVPGETKLDNNAQTYTAIFTR